MDCAEVEQKLDAYVLGDQERAERAGIATHLRECDGCRARLCEREQLVQALRERAALRAAGQVERMRAAVRAMAGGNDGSDSPVLRSWPSAWLTLAASLLIALGGLAWLLRPAGHGPSPSARLAWVHANDCPETVCFAAAPVVSGSRLVALRRHAGGTVAIAFDKAGGRPLWQTSFQVHGPVVADRRRVYAWKSEGRARRALVALDSATGAALWQVDSLQWEQAPDPGVSMVLLEQGLYVAGGDRVFGLDLRTGETLWSMTLDRRPVLALAAGNKVQTVYVASTESLAALDPSSGVLQWRQAHPRTLSRFAPPLLAVDERAVYLAHRTSPEPGGRLTGYAAASGSWLWDQATRPPYALRVFKGKVYLKSAGMDVYAANSGTPLWTAEIEGCSPVAVWENTAYLVSGPGRQTIVALDPAQGTTQWEFRLASSCSGFVIENGRGYVSGHDGTLYVLTLEDRG